ncbi:hypothetical protein SAMN05444008_11564 [Cnuella takakiae]|uniref:Uncharacterized protein n=1 Tax=Cnuella takakiae TaxID=1302690 RepID=A0A1M5G1Q6_9BACT|nr:hypothetical protein [Cnuella takakiae]OLY92298.1 hypothetical protein BUE76_10630 [Cnuella takakiae]SHF97653.1 hypothetical protein SAMN05444008_11564 [Cnuella takakiae]
MAKETNAQQEGQSIADLQKEKAELISKIQAEEQNSAAKDEMIAELKSVLEQLKEAYAKINEEVAHLKNENASLHAGNTELQSTNEALERVNEDLTEKIEELSVPAAAAEAGKPEVLKVPEATFLVNKKKYAFIAPVFHFGGNRIVAETALADKALLEKLVAQGAGVIKEVK